MGRKARAVQKFSAVNSVERQRATWPKHYKLDRARARLYEDFFSECLTHVKGEWAGQPFLLDRWQKDIIRPLFGTIDTRTGLRVYREAYIEIPRKNGKSSLGAGIGLASLSVDREPGAEVYSAAGDREQAAIVFEVAKQMVLNDDELSGRLRPFKRTIAYDEFNAFYKVLSADAKLKHGLNPHCVVFDELHTQPDRELYDVLRTGAGARRQPLQVYLTTAGFDRQSICWEVREYARKVLNGTVDDPTFLAVIYSADESENWTDERVWRRANPGLGRSVKIEFLRKECATAQESPAYENTFRRLYLNQWTKQETRWIPMQKWDACPDGPTEPQLIGRDCYSGLDLSQTIDITALVHIFYDEDTGFYDILPRFWIPKENIWRRVKRDRVPYDLWMEQGWIIATPGNAIDYDYVIATIDQDAKQFGILEMAFDRWGSRDIYQTLNSGERKGTTEVQPAIEMIEFGQGFASMSAPMKTFLRLLLNGKIRHGGNPVLRWMADNIVVSQDPAGNIKPNKEKSTDKIDGIVATIMALARAIVNSGGNRSKYEKEGLASI